MDELPKEMPINLDVLWDSLYHQIWAFAEYINDSDGKVETWKYFDMTLYCLHKKFIQMGYKSKWEYPGDDNA